MELQVTDEDLQEFPEIDTTDITDKHIFTSELLFKSIESNETFKERLKLDKASLTQRLGLDQLENKAKELIKTAPRRPLQEKDKSVNRSRKRTVLDRSRRNETALHSTPVSQPDSLSREVSPPVSFHRCLKSK